MAGTFASVPWSNGKLYVKTEMDLQGGTNYTTSGTTQLLSVPYSLYASDVPISKSGDTVTIGKSKLVIPGSQLLPPASLSNGLVAYYPFNGNANDESGNGNHGTVNGAILTTDRFGILNKAYSFNGFSSAISFASGINSMLNITGDITLSLFIKTDQITTGNIISFGSQVSTQAGYLVSLNIFNSAPGKVGYHSNEPWVFSNGTINNNSWRSLIVTQRNNVVSIYFDGALNTQTNNNLKIKSWSGNRKIGVRNDASIEFYKGLLDDVRIYNRALTQEEITYLANN